MKTHLAGAILLTLGGVAVAIAAAPAWPLYEAREGAIVARDGRSFNNRPLYCANTGAFVLAGDRPFIRFAEGRRLHGCFQAAIVRGERSQWLHECEGVVSSYRAGRMSWEIRDPSWEGLELKLEVLPLADRAGFAVRVQWQGAREGDRLVWVYGGAAPHIGKLPAAAWEFDILLYPEKTQLGFEPAACAGDLITIEGHRFTLRDATANWPLLAGACDVGGPPKVADASVLPAPARLFETAPGELPLVCGQLPLGAGREAHLVCELAPTLSREPAAAFAAAESRVEALARRVVVETPDPRLDAIATAGVAAVDGTWIPPVFVHGGMAWNQPFPGWRTVFGGTAFGWHERVLAQARHYLATQIKESPKRTAKSDPKFLLTKESPDSRFFGKGRIERDQRQYNMQSQFFDQLVHAWRWTGDPELEALLRPALELHLEWQRECFDPDGDGCYESYINVWPTDSTWYNGGGSVEESIYAWRGHEAARDLARRAGDSAGLQRHEEAMARIRRGFFEKLWIPHRGHAGLYIEQGGHRRRIENAWLYSIFLPVDSTLLTPAQAAQSLHYTDWALQNDPGPDGGRRVWTSNFVPGIWSVREYWPGDNYHLALAYFQTGLGRDGWDLFRANFLDSALGLGVPGNLGYWKGGTDFGDCVHMFARTLVEGLFGFRPDTPNGMVRIAPQLPAAWDRAAIRTPDFALRYRRGGERETWSIELARPGALELLVPVRARHVESATLDGQPIAFEVVPGFGQSIVRLRAPGARGGEFVISTRDALPLFEPLALRANVGERIDFPAAPARVIAVADPQEVFETVRIDDGRMTATIADRPGHHTAIATVEVGGAPQWRRIHLTIASPKAEAAERARSLAAVPPNARWECLDLRGSLNADVRTIYEQRYLAPRPATVSVRIGTDGYSPWTFLHWKSPPPSIGLDRVAGLLNSDGRLATPQGVPFHWPGDGHNIAFTSLWENFPARLTIPVGKPAEAVWFLVCGSTTVMQCRIPNAVLRLQYADGREDALELVPPFNYWNLSPITANARSPGQEARTDYTDPVDAFAVPKPWPETVQLGANCRAVLLNRRLPPQAVLAAITLETLSQEVVVGLMGVTLMNDASK